ncbi:hypothetical protein [uncultured Desulfovibrio sp.]|uniref:hypothetical protein n=1 Tax=uncultured Desulfovibrio sp. TaxID=167968 RepID=UPI002615539F|nr:hypothetical protein [uncultured Desulfovibrio sp.]
MAEIYVKHKKTYFLVKMVALFVNVWLVICALLTVLDLCVYLYGGHHRYAEGILHPKAIGFLLAVVFLLILRYLCKFFCKKLEHHIALN